jgi:hypothetical protein
MSCWKCGADLAAPAFCRNCREDVPKKMQVPITFLLIILFLLSFWSLGDLLPNPSGLQPVVLQLP